MTKLSIVVFVAVATAACAGSGGTRPVTDSARRVELRGFSVLPPRGPDWSEVRSMSEELRRVGGSYGVVFMKGWRTRPPSTPLEAEAVLAMAIATVVTPAPAEQILDEAISRRRAEVGRGRFGPGALNATHERWAGAACRRYDFSLEDYGHPRFPEAVFVLAGRGLLCAHPQDAGLVIDAHFSQRTLRGHPPTSVSSEMTPFLDSVAITTVR